MHFKYVSILVFIIMGVNLLSGVKSCDAFLFHATRKAAAKRILKKGFSRAKMRSTARFGKGVYTSIRKKTAVKEAGRVGTVIKFNDSKYLKKNTINFNRPTPKKIHKYLKGHDLRGSVKHNIIGPKLGKKIGSAASRKGKAIRYRSTKDLNGENIFIPQQVYSKNPRIITPKK